MKGVRRRRGQKERLISQLYGCEYSSNRIGDADCAAVLQRNLSSSTAADCAEPPMSTIGVRGGKDGKWIAAGREDMDFGGEGGPNK